jgi:hypothetical protein
MFEPPICFRHSAFVKLICPAVFAAALAAAVFSGSQSVRAVVVTDDFSDGNDTINPVWTHLERGIRPGIAYAVRR